jgi:hypothetical protein
MRHVSGVDPGRSHEQRHAQESRRPTRRPEVERDLGRDEAPSAGIAAQKSWRCTQDAPAKSMCSLINALKMQLIDGDSSKSMQAVQRERQGHCNAPHQSQTEDSNVMRSSVHFCGLLIRSGACLEARLEPHAQGTTGHDVPTTSDLLRRVTYRVLNLLRGTATLLSTIFFIATAFTHSFVSSCLLLC